MRESKFKIGDRVETNWIGTGKVTDVLYSPNKDAYTYEVVNDMGAVHLFSEDELKLAEAPTVYGFEVTISGNVAVVTMNATQGLKTHVYARGPAHILHDGEVGIAQAVSYAAKRMFESLDSQQESKIYLKGGIQNV